MIFRWEATSWDTVQCDAIFLPIFEDDDFSSGLPKEVNSGLEGLLSEMRVREELSGEKGECVLIPRPSGCQADRLVLAGAGRRSQYNGEGMRRVLMTTLSRSRFANLKSILILHRLEGDPGQTVQATVEALVMSSYHPDEFKTTEKSHLGLERVEFLKEVGPSLDTLKEAAERGQILGEATNLARKLVNLPGNSIGPSQLADEATQLAERYGLDIQVLGEPELEAEGMNALLGVARGSDEPARLIMLRHEGAGEGESPVVLVGKGVTFDSGGLSLKTPEGMIEMKTDKAGACAVLAAMTAIARLRLRRNVVGLIPAVENLPSGRAQRPGDVVRSFCGKTIEIINTDAEGRLILADALSYSQRFEPVCIVDLATLTGACVVALGKIRAGAFCNDDPLFTRIETAASRAGERIWRMPLDSEYRRDLDSEIADIKNAGGRWGGACIAAKFLEEFVEGRPWCHLDIAGVDLFPEKSSLKGPTGFGVRTLVELLVEG